MLKVDALNAKNERSRYYNLSGATVLKLTYRQIFELQYLLCHFKTNFDILGNRKYSFRRVERQGSGIFRLNSINENANLDCEVFLQ